MELNERCLVCGSKNWKSLYESVDPLCRDLNRDAKSNQPALPHWNNKLEECRCCQFVRMNPVPDEKLLGQIYSKWYGHSYIPNEAARNSRKMEFRNYHWKLLKHYLNATDDLNLLDVGAGNGLFIASIEDDTPGRLRGIESDFSAVEQSKSNLRRSTVEVGTIHTLPEEWSNSSSYDVVTMFDYLEHTRTPEQDLAAAFRLLKPLGLLAVRVPNIHGLQARMMRGSWLGVISVHLAYFSLPSLGKLLEKNGFKVVHIYRGNFATARASALAQLGFVVSRVSARPLQRTVSDSVEGRPTKKPLTIVRGFRFLISQVWFWLDFVGGVLGMGNNLYVVAVKNEKIL